MIRRWWDKLSDSQRDNIEFGATVVLVVGSWTAVVLIMWIVDGEI